MKEVEIKLGTINNALERKGKGMERSGKNGKAVDPFFCRSDCFFHFPVWKSEKK